MNLSMKIQEARIYGRTSVWAGSLDEALTWLKEELGREPVEDQDYFLSNKDIDENGEFGRSMSFAENFGFSIYIPE